MLTARGKVRFNSERVTAWWVSDRLEGSSAYSKATGPWKFEPSWEPC